MVICPPKRLFEGVFVFVPKSDETGVNAKLGFSDEPNKSELPENNLALVSVLEKRLEVGSSSIVFPPGPIAKDGLLANKLSGEVVVSVGFD